jgi:asparagine synthase (glutamine-hydrolysing)
MSMMRSLESRVPFLDHEFVEFSTMVRSLNLCDGEAKYIVKKDAEDLPPAEIVYCKKMGFPTPLRQRLRDSRADRHQKVESLVERQKNGRYDVTDRIWKRLSLQLWGDLFRTGKPDERWDELLPLAAV